METTEKLTYNTAFAKPSDAENPLADMYYYSTPYYTDRVSQMSQEIGIDNRFKEMCIRDCDNTAFVDVFIKL